MATYELRAINSSGNAVDKVTTTATGPGTISTVENLFFLPTGGGYTFAAVTPETAPYEVVRAPTASTSPVISGIAKPGETVTINEGTYTGTTPITITFTLTLDGVDVTADVVGSGYTIPAGTDGQALVYTETASNGTAPDATQSVTETVASWFPSDLFQTGEAGFAFDFSNVLETNTLANQTGTIPAVGDPVGYLPDISGNAKTAIQTTLAERPTLRQDGAGKFYLEFVGSDLLRMQQDMASDTWSVWMVYEPDGGDFIILSEMDETFPWVGIGQQGSTNTGLAPSTGVSSVTSWYGTTQFTGTTRGQSWTEAQAANLVIVEAGISDTNVPDVAIGDYNQTGNFSTPGGVYAWGAINRPLTSQERNELLAYAGRVRGV